MEWNLASDVLNTLRLQGLTLATAESCTGGWVGRALTAVPGSSQVYRGGVISYTDAVKEKLLDVPRELLDRCGAVSEPVAKAMAQGARKVLEADVAVSVTGLAGPEADGFKNPVGTVYLGYADGAEVRCVHCQLEGGREAVRRQACQKALELILACQREHPLHAVHAKRGGMQGHG